MQNSKNAPPCEKVCYSLLLVLVKEFIAGASLEILKGFKNTQEQFSAS